MSELLLPACAQDAVLHDDMTVHGGTVATDTAGLPAERGVCELLQEVHIRRGLYGSRGLTGYPRIYLQDPEMYTLQIAMNQLKSYFAGRNVPAMMAATVISIIPTIVLYIIAQKRFVEGVATSGMKV